MELCHNNPYINKILIDCETKLAQQHGWYENLRKNIITLMKGSMYRMIATTKGDSCQQDAKPRRKNTIG